MQTGLVNFTINDVNFRTERVTDTFIDGNVFFVNGNFRTDGVNDTFINGNIFFVNGNFRTDEVTDTLGDGNVFFGNVNFRTDKVTDTLGDGNFGTNDCNDCYCQMNLIDNVARLTFEMILFLTYIHQLGSYLDTTGHFFFRGFSSFYQSW